LMNATLRRLLDACKEGDVEAARQAIADGADVDGYAEDGIRWFPLKYAAHPEHGNSAEIVQSLIDAGCNVNQRDLFGSTVLPFCVPEQEVTQLSIVKALLRGGADPNIADLYGRTPCHRALRRCSSWCSTLVETPGKRPNQATRHFDSADNTAPWRSCGPSTKHGHHIECCQGG